MHVCFPREDQPVNHPTRFMRVPFFVSGYCVTEDNMDDVAEWCGGYIVREKDDIPFIHVPVQRPTNDKQYKAYVDSWVILSIERGKRSFKAYTEEWLKQQFMEIAVETLEDQGIPGMKKGVVTGRGPRMAKPDDIPQQYRNKPQFRFTTSS